MATPSLLRETCASVVRHVRIVMHDDRNGGTGAGAHGQSHLLLRRFCGNPFLVLARRTLDRSPACAVLDRLPLDAVQRFADGGGHIGCFGRSDQGMVSRRDRDVGLEPMFLAHQDDLRLEGFS